MQGLLRVVTGRFQYPVAEGENQTGLLCQGDKLIRHQQAELRMIPADQRLYGDNTRGVVAVARLINQAELLLFKGVAQAIFHFAPLHHLLGHLRGIKHPSVAPGVFGLVERDI